MTTPLPPTSDLDAKLVQEPDQLPRRLWGKRFWAISFLGLLALYGGRSALNDQRSNDRDEESPLAAITYDAYSNDVTSVLYTDQGQIEYTLEATEQVHYLDDTTHLSNPYVRLYQGDGVRWNIVARSGRILAADAGGKISRLDLSEDVELFQIDKTGDRMTLATPFLSVFPESETMATDQEVTMTTHFLRQSAIGMRANLQQDTLTFLSEVKGRYDVQNAQP